MPPFHKILAGTAICLVAGACVSCSPQPMIELPDNLAEQACENTKREQPCPSWDEMFEIQGVYSFDYITPDDELDHGTPDILVLTPQAQGEYQYGVTIFRIFQGHHLAARRRRK